MGFIDKIWNPSCSPLLAARTDYSRLSALERAHTQLSSLSSPSHSAHCEACADLAEDKHQLIQPSAPQWAPGSLLTQPADTPSPHDSFTPGKGRWPCRRRDRDGSQRCCPQRVDTGTLMPQDVPSLQAGPGTARLILCMGAQSWSASRNWVLLQDDILQYVITPHCIWFLKGNDKDSWSHGIVTCSCLEAAQPPTSVA